MGPGQGGLSWGWADGVQPCISVDNEGDQFKIWKFYYICKKAAEFIPGVSFNVGTV